MKKNGKSNGKPKSASSATSSPETPPKSDDKQGTGTEKKARVYSKEFLANKFKPGVSGNPKGGPKKPSLVRALTAALAKAEVSREKGVDVARHPSALNGKVEKRPPTLDELAEAMLVMGASGNMVALEVLKQLLERFDGKVPIKAELTGKDGDAITIRSSRDDISSRLAGQVARSGTEADPPKPN